MSITASGGYFHGYLNGTEYPFYFDGYNKSETYTKAQVDALINSLKSTYLTSNYFVRNGNPSKPFTLTYGNENASITMPEGKAIYANVLGINVPLSNSGGNVGMPDYNRKQVLMHGQHGTYTLPENGYIAVSGLSSEGFTITPKNSQAFNSSLIKNTGFIPFEKGTTIYSQFSGEDQEIRYIPFKK